MKKQLIILILACVLPLREAHRFFSLKVRPGLYFIDKSIKESPAWYIHDIFTKIFLAVAFGLWYLRERERDKIFSSFIGVFALFFTLDFILYLANHSHAGVWYLIGVYLPVLCYAMYIIKKE